MCLLSGLGHHMHIDLDGGVAGASRYSKTCTHTTLTTLVVVAANRTTHQLSLRNSGCFRAQLGCHMQNIYRIVLLFFDTVCNPLFGPLRR